MIWQREVALPLHSDWLTAGKAVNTGLAKKNLTLPKTKKKRGRLDFLLRFLYRLIFKVVMFER